MKYSEKQVQIGGLEAYIFTPQNAKLLLNDTALLEELNLRITCLEELRSNIKVAESHFDNQLFISVFQRYNRWFTSLCIKISENYIDVKYHEKWFCRRCLETIAESVLIPEEDNGIFFPTEWRYKYPSVFHFMRCKKCGNRTDRDLLPEKEFWRDTSAIRE